MLKTYKVSIFFFGLGLLMIQAIPGRPTGSERDITFQGNRRVTESKDVTTEYDRIEAQRIYTPKSQHNVNLKIFSPHFSPMVNTVRVNSGIVGINQRYVLEKKYNLTNVREKPWRYHNFSSKGTSHSSDNGEDTNGG
jgi:hypothetical protein